MKRTRRVRFTCRGIRPWCAGRSSPSRPLPYAPPTPANAPADGRSSPPVPRLTPLSPPPCALAGSAPRTWERLCRVGGAGCPPRGPAGRLQGSTEASRGLRRSPSDRKRARPNGAPRPGRRGNHAWTVLRPHEAIRSRDLRPLVVAICIWSRHSPQPYAALSRTQSLHNRALGRHAKRRTIRRAS
jgi:hypothetical protein